MLYLNFVDYKIIKKCDIEMFLIYSKIYSSNLNIIIE